VGRSCERLFPMSFCHPRHNPTEKFFSRTSFQSRCVSHMKIANVHVGTIHWNMRIALQLSYQFAIFISVCNFHISLQFSPFGVLFLRGRLQFSYWFAIFIWVCNFHISLQFSHHDSVTSYARGFRLIPVTMNLNSLTLRQSRFFVEETKKN
jgi:hypothetical protein